MKHFKTLGLLLLMLGLFGCPKKKPEEATQTHLSQEENIDQNNAVKEEQSLEDEETEESMDDASEGTLGDSVPQDAEDPSFSEE